ncbi:hypothetical protein [Candidatus Neomicrothrix sp.]|uniref:hypothetical protein n=1 Tax=Candidatus Neomicrothrix sp. TaxID=2719034 RepID=UPI001B5E539F|nr:hypothetical protein [Candidatus Microthrix sp.]MBP6150800.1 hypothetical protein [Candidatus Microthrix sp.]MBP7597032.1 hypothetical protein [Candidatus Microthrix sp.]MBP7879231.1 hypothetical protein [Candidatus Microthrix sp.]MBP9621521.1 hypothetical protein [Candidatus Microthrix sp.]
MLKKRTVVTSLSIAAIVLAGGAAVAANVGILSAADDTPIGTLSAQADMAGVAPTSPPSTSTATSADAPQRFAVENAGQVEVLRNGSKLALGEVVPSAGWQARPGTVTSDSADVTFTSGADQLVFTATLAGDGTITGAAKRPGQTSEPIPQATAASTAQGHDDDHADSDHDQADHDDDHSKSDHDKSGHDSKNDDHDGKDDDD